MSKRKAKAKMRYAYMVVRNENGNRQDYIWPTLKAAFRFIRLSKKYWKNNGYPAFELFRVDAKSPYGY